LDGDTFNIPSLGEASTQTITEDQDVEYEALDTGNFSFTITEYTGSAHYITRKALQDSFYAQRVLASFVPKESRALMQKLESDILKSPSPVNSQGAGGQTVNDPNDINSFSHRIGGSASTAGNIALQDFAFAKLALKKANVPMSNLIAIVDPVVGFTLETLSNIVNVSNNPQWEGIVTSGISTGMRFIKNIYGFDVYESNYVDSPTDATIVDYAGNSVSITSPKQNLLFSASPDVLPITGAWRQLPIVDSEFNKDKQREEYVTTARWGTKLYRPENMICILTRPDVA